MSSFIISQIDAWNEYQVQPRPQNTPAIPPGQQILWTPNTTNADGPYGSLRPNMFRNTGDALRITIRGTVTAGFPASWRGKKYSIFMSLGRSTVLQSGLVPVPQIPSNVVHVTGLFLMLPNLRTTPVDIPFMWAGDFNWALMLERSPSDMIRSTRSTRLELCWAHAPAPSGPLVDPTPNRSGTRVDMRPYGYPIILWRLFVPNLREYSNDPNLPSLTVPFYIRRSVGIVWNPSSDNPRYDTVAGRPFYAEGHLGGGYNLPAWDRKQFPRCNCYDLAGILQLACCLLMNPNGVELADSRWVFQNPNGFINPGPLLGWVRAGGDNLRCNTPFWESAATLPWVPPNAINRTSFGNHAWVEVLPQRLVLDATHALQANVPFPPAATNTRPQYLNAGLDGTRPRGTAITRVGLTGPGNCWQNPETRPQRIGVYNPWGNPTGANNLRAMAAALPRVREIEALLERGKSRAIPDHRACNASLDATSLRNVLNCGIEVTFSIVEITPTVTHLVSTLEGEGQKIITTIEVCESYEEPVNRLLSYLSGFQISPLDSVIQPREPQLGAFSFQTKTSAFWIRGNLFIRVEDFSNSVQFDSTLAEKLDTYFSANPALQAPLQLDLDRNTIPGTVKQGQKLEVQLKGDPAAWAKEKIAVSSKQDIVLTTGAANANGALELVAVSPGTASITIIGAEKGSFRPVKVSFDIVVEDSEVEDPYAGVNQLECPEPVAIAWDVYGERDAAQ